MRLCPPGRGVRAEVSLRPGEEGHNVVVDLDVCERERERCRTTDDLALRVVLRPVARALELVLCGHPRHNAAEVRADRVQAEALDLFVTVDDQVGGVTLHVPGNHGSNGAQSGP